MFDRIFDATAAAQGRLRNHPVVVVIAALVVAAALTSAVVLALRPTGPSDATPTDTLAPATQTTVPRCTTATEALDAFVAANPEGTGAAADKVAEADRLLDEVTHTCPPPRANRAEHSLKAAGWNVDGPAPGGRRPAQKR